MSRKEELLNLIDGNQVLLKLVDDIVYLEKQLEYLRALPQIKVNPDDPNMQKATPASKLYKDSLNLYINSISKLMKATGIDIEDDESPLREWMKKNVEFR